MSEEYIPLYSLIEDEMIAYQSGSHTGSWHSAQLLAPGLYIILNAFHEN